jgi:ribonucleoside-diphosphate reductase subunit M1
LAKLHGPYPSFSGSPLSKGILHFEYFEDWNQYLSSELDWISLRNEIIQFGVRNSLFIAPMPTASTSQILGNTESFEPLTSNLYLRRTSAGEFYILNPYLRSLMQKTNLWNDRHIHQLILYKGSVLNLTIPQQFKNVFRTVWEIPQKHLIEMAADRQMFIDQSQSFNIYLPKPEMSLLTKIHFYGWKKKLKTGCYYLRTRSAISAQSISIDYDNNSCTSCSA